MRFSPWTAGILATFLALGSGLEAARSDEPVSIVDSATTEGIGRFWQAGHVFRLTKYATFTVPDGMEFADRDCLCISEQDRSTLRQVDLAAAGWPLGQAKSIKVQIKVNDQPFAYTDDASINKVEEKKYEDRFKSADAMSSNHNNATARFSRWIERRNVDPTTGTDRYAYEIAIKEDGSLRNEIHYRTTLSAGKQHILVTVIGEPGNDVELAKVREATVAKIDRGPVGLGSQEFYVVSPATKSVDEEAQKRNLVAISIFAVVAAGAAYATLRHR